MSGREYVVARLARLSGDGATTVRPLVAIDPEDREALDRLTKALVKACYADGNVVCADNGIHPDTMQAALREFANPTPPKPEEPTGLGAVVEDAEGVRWIRCFMSDIRGSVWRRTGDKAEHRAANVLYADIDAVRVLSEGVTA